MEIIVAKSAGFCFGVKRAVDCVYDKVKRGTIYTYGAIIHNKEVIKDLEKRNVKIVETEEQFNEIQGGEIIIRSHGVVPDVYKKINEKGLPFTDCTCPFVKKIHTIVKEDYEKGFSIIIVGNGKHPEVIGINGWANGSAIIIDSIGSAKKYFEENLFDKEKKYSLVVQTTFQTNVFNEINEFLKHRLYIKNYNTICSATAKRQTEAIEIAKIVDVMLVIGDTKSSNTQKLYEISKKYCKKTFLCETIRDLQLNIFHTNDRIGITAGASTPPTILKEAINIMSELDNQLFEEMISQSFVTLHTGDIVKGTVIQVSNGEVTVNLGYKSDGIISRAEFSDDPDIKIEDVVKVGDEIEVYVVRVNDGEGNVQLSKKRLEATKGFATIEEAFNNGEILKGKIADIIKGGFIAIIENIRVFVPSSQISNRFVENLKEFKGKEFNFKILEFDKSKRRIVAGRKELAQKEYEELKNKIFDGISVGDKLEGTVSRIVDFGAFVDLGGVDGLIHISELSWGRVKKVKDVLAVGDKVSVNVLEINKEKGKISLSLKDISDNPWNGAEEEYAVGSVVTGKVVRMVPFGAFIELKDGVDGLVHISQIAYKHVVRPEDELKIGQEITAKITDFDLQNKKISLSIKEVMPKPEEADVKEEIPAEAENYIEEANEKPALEDKAEEDSAAEAAAKGADAAEAVSKTTAGEIDTTDSLEE